MSWSRSPSSRRAVLMGLGSSLLILPGCLKPMLAKDAGGSAIRTKVRFPDYQGRFGYFLDQSLRSRLGAPDQPQYRLEIQTQVSETGLAIAQDNSVTRITMSAQASWQLWPVGGAEGDPLLSDSMTVQSGYSATTSLFATRQTRLDIERRLAREVGQRIARTIQARADQVLSQG